MYIAILEDNPERTMAMRDCLAVRLDTLEAVFFVTAAEMIVWLETNFRQTVVISLDHDLEPQETDVSPAMDPGTGREVANFIAQRSPCCPVIVHSTNLPAAFGMISELNDAGWETLRVVPYDDLLWITEAWLPAMQSAIRN